MTIRITLISSFLLFTTIQAVAAPGQTDARPAEMTNQLGMVFVLVPAGGGSLEPFYLSKAEVTLGQFRRFRPTHGNGTTKWGRRLEHPDLPVTSVSPTDAAAFCTWLGEQDGGAYRLPTESEWEHAGRAGSRQRYYFGSDNLQLRHYAWYDDNASGLGVRKEDKGPRLVGQKLPNDWGLFDMLGNVAEWCTDQGGRAVRCGGHWASRADQCTCSRREVGTPGTSDLHGGFRVVMVRPPVDDDHGQVRWSRIGQRLVVPLFEKAKAKAAVADGARVAVIPLASGDQGTTELGLVLAAGIEVAVLDLGPYRLVDRRTLDRVLAEKDLAFADMSDMSRANAAIKALAADVLIVGDLADAGRSLQTDVRMVKVADAEVVAATGLSLQKDRELQSLTRIVQRPRQSQNTSGELPPLSLGYHVFGQRYLADGGFEEVIVREGSTLRSGDQYRINVQANSDCYLYTITYDSLGDVYPLFPHPQINMSNYIRGGVEYLIPGEHDPWFTLDDNVGTETLFLIASYEPLKDLEQLIKRMIEAGKGGQEVKQRIAHLQASQDSMAAGRYRVSGERGTVLRRPKARFKLSNGRPVQQVMAIVEGKSRVVQAISFKHVR